jgi:hypothetical protein
MNDLARNARETNLVLSRSARRKAEYSQPTHGSHAAIVHRKVSQRLPASHQRSRIFCIQSSSIVRNGKRILMIMPAYRAGRTLEATWRDLPRDIVDDIVVVDDASDDDTVPVARALGLDVILHPRNAGYGGNQKTCYREAWRAAPTSSSRSIRTTSTTRTS